MQRFVERLRRAVDTDHMRLPTGEQEAAPSKPELVIGLVGAVGTALQYGTDAVSAALAPYGYKVVRIRLSALMREVQGAVNLLPEITHEDERIWRHMDAGDEIRNQAERNDAVAGLAVGWISEYRREHHGGVPALNTAFVLDSLKHPAELESMRQIYRDRFIAVSIHSPTEARFELLSKKIAASHDMPEQTGRFEALAEKIMKRDEHDDEREFGQNVREAFVEGDVYVSTRPQSELDRGISRYFRLFFGDPFVTPTQDEYAMFQTHAAALRSGDLSRQVGAAVCTSEGEIVAVGCNEVPRAFGGQYWPGDRRDCRDFQLGYDSNIKYREQALAEAFDQLGHGKQLREEVDIESFVASLQGTRLTKITEFGRTVHAEMAALLDAARRGVSVAGHQLFTTTFPCHNCARHIIGAGIREVVYREPYEKSLANELHKDAIAVDPSGSVLDKLVIRRFVGVGPPRYIDLFRMTKRKDSEGNRIEWAKRTAMPRMAMSETAYLNNEEEFLDTFKESISTVDLLKGETRWR